MRLRAILITSLALALTLGAAPPHSPTTPAAVPDCIDLELGPEDPPPPVGVLVECPGIRPGAFHRAPGGCTFNFVFHGTRYDEVLEEWIDEGLFIGTAGHCIFDEATDATVWAEGEGIETVDGQGQRVGESIFAIDIGALDFGLIRIDDDREDEVEPAVCHFGGPVASATQRPAGTLLHHFGNGTGFGETVQGRTGRVDHYSGGGSVMNFTGAASPGDSGSSVIDEDGNAVGILVRLAPGQLAGYIEATDLELHLGLAEQATGIEFELQTAPLAD